MSTLSDAVHGADYSGGGEGAIKLLFDFGCQPMVRSALHATLLCSVVLAGPLGGKAPPPFNSQITNAQMLAMGRTVCWNSALPWTSSHDVRPRHIVPKSSALTDLWLGVRVLL